MSAVDRYEREMDRCRCGVDEAIGRIHAGAPGQASVYVCSLRSHREAAEGWVRALTGLEPEFTPFPADVLARIAKQHAPRAEQLSLLAGPR